MEPDLTQFQIPDLFSDYRRRLICYGSPGEIDAESRAFEIRLQKYIVPDGKWTFRIEDKLAVILWYVREEFTAGQVIAELKPDFSQMRCEADARMVLSATPISDTLYVQQWALTKIEAEAAWARVAEMGEQNPRLPVRVAIIDSGIKSDHDDLDSQGIVGARIIPPTAGNIFADDEGHGTMLSGTIAAVSDNEKGIAGEARGVQLIAIKITDLRTPPTAFAGGLGILAAALGFQAQVINASWHCLANTAFLNFSISLAFATGAVVVVAAGNYGSNNREYPTLPASDGGSDRMIVVMASDRHDRKSWFSNYDKDLVDLAAPGDGILSTGIYYVNPRYPEYTGTSPAAAHVSGAAALLLAIDDWNPGEIRAHLNNSADPLQDLPGICKSDGRLNLKRAVLGPINVVKPAGGQDVHAGSTIDVEWTSDYPTPVVTSVRISLVENGSEMVLADGLPTAGQHFVTLPSAPKPNVFIRVRAKQNTRVRNLYADSKPFDIII